MCDLAPVATAVLERAAKESGVGWVDVMDAVSGFVRHYPLCPFSDLRERCPFTVPGEYAAKAIPGKKPLEALKAGINVVRLIGCLDLLEEAYAYFDREVSKDTPPTPPRAEYTTGVLSGFFLSSSVKLLKDAKIGNRRLAAVERSRQTAFAALREVLAEVSLESDLRRFVWLIDHPLEIG